MKVLFSLQLSVLLWVMGMLPQTTQAQDTLALITPDVFLCSVAGASATYDIAASITGSFASLTLTASPQYGTANFNAAGALSYTPTSSLQVIDQFAYAACTATGACSYGNIYVTLADIESLPPIEPTYSYYSATLPYTTDICTNNIGWVLQHNGNPGLYTVTLTNNESLGSLSYISDECVLYTPTASGSDTIKIVGCGDAPPPTFLTCNGWETMNTCSYTYLVVNISLGIQSSFIETHSIACDSTLNITGLGYPTWAVPTIIDPPANGTATINTIDLMSLMSYTPNPEFSGIDTVVVECAHATQITCETGMYIFNVNCGAVNTYHFSESHIADCLSTTYIPLGCGNTPTIMAQPENGIATILYGNACNYLVYMPFDGFMGQDSIGVACAVLSASGECQNGLYNIDAICEPGSGGNTQIITLDCDSTYTSGFLAGGWSSPAYILLPPKHGTATILSDHYLHYIPQAGFTGSDTVWVDCAFSGPADGCLSLLLIFQVDCDNSVSGIDGDALLQIAVLPNTHSIDIRLNPLVSLAANIDLIDLNGRIAARFTAPNADNRSITLDYSPFELPRGIYVLRIPTSAGVVSRKLIITQ